MQEQPQLEPKRDRLPLPAPGTREEQLSLSFPLPVVFTAALGNELEG